jgi:DNA-binding Lrp family transcriptional regulator
MSTRVFMLIETAEGKAADVVGTLRKYPEIKSVDLVDGPFDVIAVVEEEDLPSVGKLVCTEIDPIDGINCAIVSVCVS